MPSVAISEDSNSIIIETSGSRTISLSPLYKNVTISEEGGSIKIFDDRPVISLVSGILSNTMLLSNQNSIAIEGVGAQGPQGPQGPSGDGVELTEPVLTYSDGLLIGIIYSGGETKDLSYTDGQLTSMVFNDGQTTVTKQFNYTDGLLTSITET